MNKNYKVLELDKILIGLSELTACEDAARMAEELMPSNDFFEVQTLLAQTESAYVLIAKFGAPSFGGMKNVNNSLSRAGAGGTLSMRELLDISSLLRAIRGITSWHEKCSGIETAIDDLLGSLYPNKYLEDKINNAIISDTEISDNASPELKTIRRKMKSQEVRIREQLDKLLRSPTYKNSLQDAIVTQRNGRFVVPVKSEHRSDISGMVHDTSGSGATVFIEPSAVVEANNEIKVLESKERDEIERILFDLSVETGTFADTIKVSYESSVELNLIFSKANLAYKMKASMPIINSRGVIELKKARHPLLSISSAVPIDVKIGENFDSLVITGPNTGGKTVSIKTIGLLTLMAECGLFIPASDNSKIAVFDKVLADIGEEQSIEQSLSTFSAHMTNIVSIINETNSNTLVLIDELGAGTDPVEGAALAVAILEELRQKGTKIAATTHYSELKEYALNTKRVENASCEFNVETLRPTYKLLTGIPGRSNAFAISEKLGLSAAVIVNAQKFISAESTRFEDVVETLENTRRQMENEKDKTQQMQDEIDEIKKSAEKKLEDATKKAEKEIELAKGEAGRIVENAKRAANSLLLEIDMLKKEQTKEKNIAEMARKAKAAMKQHLNDIDDLTADNLNNFDDENYVLPRELKLGDTVFVKGLGTNATIISLADNKGNIEVQAGIMKMKVQKSDLRLIGEKKTKDTKIYGRTVKSELLKTAHTSVDLRGLKTEEAIWKLDLFIDSVLRTGLNEITIVHGKGTGVLRKGIQTHLKKHPNIKTFRTGVYGEGEEGVTIAELK
ncbi:MAG: endonuclease MutS2 [Oscillospiraceae bacterium]